MLFVKFILVIHPLHHLAPESKKPHAFFVLDTSGPPRKIGQIPFAEYHTVHFRAADTVGDQATGISWLLKVLDGGRLLRGHVKKLFTT